MHLFQCYKMVNWETKSCFW